MRRGSRLGVDVGKARVGLSQCDPEGLLATPVATLPRATAHSALAEEITQRKPLEVVVGYPLALSGNETESTRDAVRFAEELAELVSVPVRLVDERLSTVQATQNLHAAGKSGRGQRAVIDQAAAVILLQHALDTEKYGGVPPGYLVSSKENDV